jgi:hypothetical protein
MLTVQPRLNPPAVDLERRAGCRVLFLFADDTFQNNPGGFFPPSWRFGVRLAGSMRYWDSAFCTDPRRSVKLLDMEQT